MKPLNQSIFFFLDSAAQRAPEKSKVGEKEKTFFLQQLYFLKSYKQVGES